MGGEGEGRERRNVTQRRKGEMEKVRGMEHRELRGERGEARWGGEGGEGRETRRGLLESAYPELGGRGKESGIEDGERSRKESFFSL